MLSFFPRDVLDEILDLIESVSEGFPTYSYATTRQTKLTPTVRNNQKHLNLKITSSVYLILFIRNIKKAEHYNILYVTLLSVNSCKLNTPLRISN